MAADKSITREQRNLLAAILRIKKAKGDMQAIQEEVRNAVVSMSEEDVSYVEKIIGEKTI